MEAQFGKDITINQDPNHYVKGLIKSFEHLTEDFPALADLGASLKTHFLLGVKYHWNEEAFCSHMRGFVPHTTDECHTQCLHAPQPQKTTPHLHPVNDAAAVDALWVFIEGYVDD
ncbi:uncharacterized protein ACA1_076480 [Acanthamoeba castellanii str. Neff]|uniref:Uncharacterized protein n=1 Tax=Acanthamoeba castellanii (strain ATCC 30010 / Neff) TaxID=1257118 RepID=L8GL49_ACACF|nr:uncharacterized protein ACA1_076480 [Acanthamoeba castellanii str. Neff]ELR13795.1 hypothetical protein ACA1_076480 [Acanthamoeba castellanii str. Neff]